MFDAKVGIRRYKFKNDMEWQLAHCTYDDVVKDVNECGADVVLVDEYAIQMLFEDGLEARGIEVIYATP